MSQRQRDYRKLVSNNELGKPERQIEIIVEDAPAQQRLPIFKPVSNRKVNKFEDYFKRVVTRTPEQAKGAESYKQSLFGGPFQLKINGKPTSEATVSQSQAPSTTKHKESSPKMRLTQQKQGDKEEDKNSKLKRQMATIQSCNQPAWVQHKRDGHDKNVTKYQLSSRTSYNFDSKHDRDYGYFTTKNLLTKQALQAQIKAEKKRVEEKLERKHKREERKLRENERLHDELCLMVGLPRKQVKPNEDEPNEGLHNIEVLNQLQESEEEGTERNHFNPSKRRGLDEIVKPYAHDAPLLLKLILCHDYSRKLVGGESKKIPEIFEGESVYRKIFHYLVTNECITDIEGRMMGLSRANPLSARVIRVRKDQSDNIELHLQQNATEEDKQQLKKISLSTYRLVLISSSPAFQMQKYGVSSQKDFSFVALLQTPTNKEELYGCVKANAIFPQLQIEYLQKRQAVFVFDLQKLTTHVRQYVSISNIAYSELAPAILNPRLLETQASQFVEERQKALLGPVLSQLKTIFNPTQFESIREMVLRQSGIVLLQGPPGTGKTSTLLGLISAQYQYIKQTGDPRKIMICAPSNTAVDHIAKRLVCEGIINGQGSIIKPKIVRLGIVDSLDEDIIGISLEHICQGIILQTKGSLEKQGRMSTPQIKEEAMRMHRLALKSTGQQHKHYQQEATRLENMLLQIYKEKVVTSRKRFAEVEENVLRDAEIILSTLSSSGSEKASRIRGEIACLIVDEAAQATEPTLLIALQSGVEKILLIGDPCQLPATCMSTDANVTLFNRSLFQRCIDAGIRPYFLNIQYRMAPLIREFPSMTFYQDRLLDGQSLSTNLVPFSLQKYETRPLCFLDIRYGEERKRYDSYENPAEVETVIRIVQYLIDKELTIGIITPYQAQCKAIMRRTKVLTEQEQELFESTVMVKTIDSFQGQEKDVIIVSTVRANSSLGVGFLVDERRINVMLTRAKHLLIVVGNADTLGTNEIWDSYLTWTASKRVYYEVLSRQELSQVINSMCRVQGVSHPKRCRSKRLSRDHRKNSRREIQSKDFKVPSGVSKNEKKGEIFQCSPSKIEKKEVVKADERQNKRLIEDKRRKESEAQRFEETYNQVTSLENQFKKGKADDQFLRQMFM